MKKYYFTFGQNHFTVRGLPMKDYWVAVQAPDFITARALFTTQFSIPIMGIADKWAFQYEEDKFDPSYFPGGQYAIFSS